MKPSFRFIQSGILALAASAGVLIALSAAVSDAADNTYYGAGALQSGTRTGADDSAFGVDALHLNTTGGGNTATGVNALADNQTGDYNTANGQGALTANTANGNTATGFDALHANTTGLSDVACGYQALYLNTNGSYNAATGFDALNNNTTGYENTADGGYALYSNTIGDEATALGEGALFSNTDGSEDTATGIAALYSNTSGNGNTADGDFALYGNTTGGSNTAEGGYALYTNLTGVSNTAEGYQALYNSIGSNNTALGVSAGINITDGGDNIDIANSGDFSDNNIIRIGSGQAQAYIAGIENDTVSNGAVVYVTTSGQLGVETSSRRFKQDIESMGDASDVLLSLKPVTFEYKPEIDPKAVPQFGLVAEEVEKACPALVINDKDGKPYTVRYEAVNAMLLNEFLKEHRRVEAQGEALAAQEKRFAAQERINAQQQQAIKELTASLKEQAALIQKVSAEVQVNKPAPPRMAGNDE